MSVCISKGNLSSLIIVCITFRFLPHLLGLHSVEGGLGFSPSAETAIYTFTGVVFLECLAKFKKAKLGHPLPETAAVTVQKLGFTCSAFLNPILCICISISFLWLEIYGLCGS